MNSVLRAQSPIPSSTLDRIQAKKKPGLKGRAWWDEIGSGSEKRRDLLYDFGAGFSGLIMNDINHLVELTAGFFHFSIVKLLFTPDGANLVDYTRPAVIHTLGCHGKTGGCLRHSCETTIYGFQADLGNLKTRSDLWRFFRRQK
ncbi:MAG: hypothetical protein OXT73_04260 [Bacteroidota bacterium]|nr:hypothetical protein [Bacteroidota bacterium]